jgi:hypothetical protein
MIEIPNWLGYTILVASIFVFVYFLSDHPAKSPCESHETEIHGTQLGGGPITLCVPK